MVAFICLFFPAFVAVNVLSKLQKKEFNFKEIIFNYIFFEIIFLLMVVFILSFIFGNKEFYLDQLSFNNFFTFKYLGISLFLICFLPLLYEIVRKNIKINLEFNKKINMGSNSYGRKKKK